MMFDDALHARLKCETYLLPVTSYLEKRMILISEELIVII